jgi:hypothetical protein
MGLLHAQIALCCGGACRIYATDAAQRTDKVTVKASGPKTPDMGQTFIDFITVETGQAILGRHGFKKP